MSARIDIINTALILLGEKAITSLEDDSSQAEIMNDLYPISRDSTLEAHEWSFAIRTFTPALSTEQPGGHWTYAYPLPSDIIRLLEVDQGTTNTSRSEIVRNQIPHEIQGRNILTNQEIGFCTGIRRVEDEGIYSNLFCEAFAAKLAMKACLAITESNTRLQSCAALYESFISQAKSRDGQQGTTRRVRSRWLNNARRGFYG